MSIYRIFNQGEIAGLAAGWRLVIALDWTTLETARLPLDLWQRLDPQPATGYSARRVRAAIKARLRYASKTKTICAAALLKSRA